MSNECKHEIVKLYDGTWKCMMCFEPFCPSDWVVKTVAPPINKSALVVAKGLLHDALEQLEKVDE